MSATGPLRAAAAHRAAGFGEVFIAAAVRRHHDVPPIEDSHWGGAPAELSANVTVTRLDPATRPRA